MASLKSKKTQPHEIIVAKINAKQAITIAAIGLIAALATPFLTNRLSIKEDTVKRDVIGYYEGRHSIINETLDDNLKTIKKFKDSIYAYGKRKDSRNKQQQELIIANKIQTITEEAKEKIGIYTQESLDAYNKGNEIEAINSRARVNAFIRETDTQIDEERRKILKEGGFCGTKNLPTEQSAIPLKPIPLLNQLNQFSVEQVATLYSTHEVGHTSPDPDKSTLSEHDFVSVNFKANLVYRSVNGRSFESGR